MKAISAEESHTSEISYFSMRCHLFQKKKCFYAQCAEALWELHVNGLTTVLLRYTENILKVRTEEVKKRKKQMFYIW